MIRSLHFSLLALSLQEGHAYSSPQELWPEREQKVYINLVTGQQNSYFISEQKKEAYCTLRGSFIPLQTSFILLNRFTTNSNKIIIRARNCMKQRTTNVSVRAVNMSNLHNNTIMIIISNGSTLQYHIPLLSEEVGCPELLV